MKKRKQQTSGLSIFGTRLKQARRRLGIAQDRLGVMIGLDEQSASARISRYENGIHEPPIQTAQLIADALQVPLPYMYCQDDRVAEVLLKLALLKAEDWDSLEDWLSAKLSYLEKLGSPKPRIGFLGF